MSNEDRFIHVLGAGSMGCLWAAHLQDLTTNQVSFISTRPPSESTESAARPTKKFDLETAFNDSDLSSHSIPMVSADEVEKIDTLLICTKSFDALPALLSLQNKLDQDSNVLLFQNGLGSQFEILDKNPNFKLYAAVSTEGVNRPTPGLVVHAGLGSTFIGPLNDLARKADSLSAQLTNFSLAIKFEQDIWFRLWNKLIINCAINPFTALIDCQNGALINEPVFLDTWPQLKHELCELMKIAGYPTTKESLEQLVFDIIHKTALNVSSMCQDARLGKRTEIDDISGFAYQTLNENNIEAPANQMLWREVKSQESKHASRH